MVNYIYFIGVHKWEKLVLKQIGKGYRETFTYNNNINNDEEL